MTVPNSLAHELHPVREPAPGPSPRDVLEAVRDVSWLSPELAALALGPDAQLDLGWAPAHLLSAVEGLLGASVLTIDAGSAALVRYLGERGGRVVAIEPDPDRAAITARRCRDLARVEVRPGGWGALAHGERFSSVFVGGPRGGDPDPRRLLARAAGGLEPDGVLLLAVENPAGLGSLPGHRGPGLPPAPSDALRLDWKSARHHLEGLGLSELDVLVPWPDRYLPSAMLFPEGCSRLDGSALEALLEGLCAQAAAPPDSAARDPGALAVCARGGALPGLADAFLLVARRTAASARGPAPFHGTLLARFPRDRRPWLATRDRILAEPGGLRIETSRLRPDLEVPAGPYRLDPRPARVPDGASWYRPLSEVVARAGWSDEGVADWARPWLEALVSRCPGPAAGDRAPADRPLPPELFAALPSQLFVRPDGTSDFVGLDWAEAGPSSLVRVLHRGLTCSLAGLRACATPENERLLHVPTLVRAVMRQLGFGLTPAREAELVGLEADFRSFLTGRPRAECLRELEARTLGLDATSTLAAARTTLVAAAVDRDRELARTAAQGELAAARHATRVARLEDDLATARQRIADLEARVPGREALRLEEEVGRLSRLVAAQADGSAHLAWLEAHSKQQAEGIEWLRNEVRVRDELLARIQGSRLWRAAHALARPWRALRGAILDRLPARAKRALGRLVDRLLGRTRDPDPAPPDEPGPGDVGVPARIAAASPTDPSRGPIPRTSTYDIVCFSIIDWEFRWQRPQQLMAGLARAGHRVFYLSTSRFPAGRPGSYEIHRLRDDVFEIRISDHHPFSVYSGVYPTTALEAAKAALRNLREDLGIGFAVGMVQVPTWSPLARWARDELGWPLVYDCMDEWTGFPGMAAGIAPAEAGLVASADLVLVSAERLRSKWDGVARRLALVRNAADFEHFAAPAARPEGPPPGPPVVGYFGALAEWFDVGLVEKLARERPQYRIVLIGGVSGVDTSGLAALPNVELLGQQEYSSLPARLAEFACCLIPFTVDPITAATDPVKFYEYLSQGKPVVATRLPELLPHRELLHLADSPDEFVAAVDAAVAEDDPAMRERRIARARANTWGHRVDAVTTAIAAAVRPVSIVVVSFGNRALTMQCLESVRRCTLYPSFEVLVVDNASPDDSVEHLRALAARDTRFRLLENSRNLGFAAANNQAVEHARGEYLVLLNNDTVVTRGWLPGLLHHLDKPGIGLVCPVTSFSGNESRIDAAYADLDGLERFAADQRRSNRDRIFDLRMAAMYCVGMRRSTWDAVGPLDEGFGVGMFEDDDYSHRVRRVGLRVVCAEDVFIHHEGQAAFRKLPSAEYEALWARNRARFETKWGIPWTPHALRPGLRGDPSQCRIVPPAPEPPGAPSPPVATPDREADP